jgi:predicted amidohydrolase
MKPISVCIVQDRSTGYPGPLNESLRGQALEERAEAYRAAVLKPQLELASRVIEAGTDLLLFREDCNGAGEAALHRVDRPDLLEHLAEEIPSGMTSACLAGLARAGGCHVCGCFIEKENGRFFNTAVLFAPSGELAGKYRKTHLPPVERLQVTPGDHLPVFDTDLGRVGMLICYDMMTPEAARVLALQGADMILWPSLGYGWWEEAGHFTIRSRAHDNQVFILAALRSLSCVVTPSGNFAAQAGLEPLEAITAVIKPGADPLQDELHHNTFLTNTPSLRERHLFERRPDLYGTITELKPPLVHRYPHTHMHDLERDPLGASLNYMANLNRLHWETIPDKTES